MNPRLMRPISVAYHPEALAWKTAAVANGGTVSTSTLAAVSTFCDAIDAAGIRDRFLRLNLVCGSNLAAARTPLYRGASSGGTQYGSGVDTNNGPFVSGDYSESTGIAGDGSSKYLDTTLTIGTLNTFGAAYDNIHVSVYRRALGALGGGDFGCADYAYYYYGNSCCFDTSGNNFGSPGFDAGSAYAGGHSITTTVGDGTNGLNLAQYYPTTSDGAYLVNDSSQYVSVYIAGLSDFNSGDATPLLFGSVWGSYDNDGDIVASIDYGTNTLSAYSVGKAFTSSAQRTAYYNAMQAFQTALGRNV